MKWLHDDRSVLFCSGVTVYKQTQSFKDSLRLVTEAVENEKRQSRYIYMEKEDPTGTKNLDELC